MLMDYLYGWPARLSLLPAVFACLLALLRVGRAAGRRPWNFATSRIAFLRRLRARVLRTFETRQPRQSLDAWDSAGDATTPRLAWDLLLVGVVVSLVVLHIAYSTPGQMYGPRYYFEALGALALLSARGLLQFGAMLGQLLQPLARAPDRARALATATVLLVALMLSGYAYDSFARDEFEAFVGWNNIDRNGLREVEAADLSNAIVFVDAPKWTDFAPFFVENDPALDADVIYALDLGTRRNQDLMRHYPGRSFYRYTDGRLVPVRGLGAGR
jgi:hypothetical protein